MGYVGARVLVELRATHPEWELAWINNIYRRQADAFGEVEIQHVDVRNRVRLEDALAVVVCHLAAKAG
ncbi:hypothetical protein PN411_10590 [Halorubrum ezzemoulense]|nr:hypothetical protein [Halorubrum ezzemoulense]MDB9253348.1 hypothetical protein [Halorubrum ezzemoulense]MDB9256287.1 hypothetical protein [Halorubrum ezzemoulense]MDB9277665.1 hypothetical protein [Halorubrum ezzemoulense]